MKNKGVVFFVSMLVMITVFSAVVTTGKQEQSSLNQSSGYLGGFFTQLPPDPGYTADDWWAYYSSTFFCGSYYQDYEMFTNVASPIQGVHWWGMSNKNNDPTSTPADPVGMTFNITFYKDNNTKPGEIVRSYSDIKPSITSTGILYPESPPTELHFFECDLISSCNLSTGWISIVSTGSDNNCSFAWMESVTGDGNAFNTMDGKRWDAPNHGFSLVLTDGVKTSIDIVNIRDGSAVTVEIKNTGDTTVANYPVDFLVIGGIAKKIEVNIEPTVVLSPGDSLILSANMFGLGKITIFVVGDGIIAYKHGIQLFMYTILQET